MLEDSQETNTSERKPRDRDLADDTSSEIQLLYGVDDTPSISTCALLGFQHYLTMAGSTLPIPVMICGLMCLGEGDPARSGIISTTFFVSGIITLLQATFGIRLPIVQGASAAYLVPTIIILTTHFSPCANSTNINITDLAREEDWQMRMREVSGALTVASLLQVILGMTGLIGMMLRWITPLAIAPTITLVGLSLFDFAGNMASTNWGIAFMTMLMIAVFSQYLENVPISLPLGKYSTKIYVFKLFPVMLSVLISWGVCAILTAANLIHENNKARTDLTPELLRETPWFTLPYPGQYGKPTVSVSGVLGMVAAVVSSIIESIGDYYACAKISGAPRPPVNAINRGIFIEGIGCVLAGVFGTANGSTSFSQNIGAIAITKVGSRRVVQYSAIFMIVFGLIGKIGAIFVSIPEPIVGGLLCIMFAVITAVGLSSLHSVNLNSSRNIFILGSSLFMGLAVPKWLKANTGIIQTGSTILDQTLSILLETSMFVGGALGFILDNSIPGSAKDRGLVDWNKDQEEQTNERNQLSNTCYDLPFGMELIRRAKWLTWVPVSPTYSGLRLREKERRDQNLA